VNPPGLIAMLVAPLVLQLSVALDPALMLDGIAANELITGCAIAVTVIVAVLITEPALLVAVRV
jgi:hypothetical protein